MNQKENPNKRFADLDEKSCDELIDGAQAKRTKYATKYSISVYHAWAAEKKLSKELHEMTIQELDETLQHFYAEVRNAKGEEYSKNTLLGFKNSVERYLNTPPHNKAIKITSNSAFARSNQMLDAKLKQLKQSGKENVKHKPAIEEQDLKKLKSSEALNCSTPYSLLRNVWFHITIHWCRRGREGQRGLTKSSFEFLTDENNKPFAKMTHDEATKNHPGGAKDHQSFEKEGRMYKTDDVNDGYDALKLYLTKLNPKCSAFFQFPKRNWCGIDEPVWYENRCLGVNKLGDMMKEISTAAELSKIYTNHCVRATAITLWSNAGLANRHIMAISGHRNEASLQSYHARPSSDQLQQSSAVISRALNPVEEQQQTSQAAHHCHQQLQTAFTRQDMSFASFGSLFSGCTVDTVNITVNPK
ncbi:hypothetical protein QZH41_005519 [Actinostola sp. cb2023]|nr:hypothetical protein QZH41_005519 [Actinostola sp. cb2023]